MTEITIKEIPVQILQMDVDTDVLVLRVPKYFHDEQMYFCEMPFREAFKALGKTVEIVSLRDEVELAVAKKK